MPVQSRDILILFDVKVRYAYTNFFTLGSQSSQNGSGSSETSITAPGCLL